MYLKPLKIGGLITAHNLILAPLAGITDYPFRQICRDHGANLTFTEMISVDGLGHNNRKTEELLKIYPHEFPIGIQLFGSDPGNFKTVMPEVCSLMPDVIDLNFGCPVRKVVAKGAGAALLKNLEQMMQIVKAVRQATGLPLTAKIRTGWDHDSIVVVEAAELLEAAGVDAVVVHARTRSQGYSGCAEWDNIARVKSSLKIPVIGNGDVFNAESALAMFRQTSCDGIMIARGALGRPWIFQQIIEYLLNRKQPEEPSFASRLKIIRTHYAREVEEFGDSLALLRMKKHFVWYTQGLPHTARLRNKIFRAKNYPEIMEIFAQHLILTEQTFV